MPSTASPPPHGFLATCSLTPMERILCPLPSPHSPTPPRWGPGAGTGTVGVGRVRLTHLVARLHSECLWRSALTLPVSPCLRECDIKIANKKKKIPWEAERDRGHKREGEKKLFFLLFKNFQWVLSPMNSAIPGFNLETAWEARSFFCTSRAQLRISPKIKRATPPCIGWFYNNVRIVPMWTPDPMSGNS